MVFRWLNSPQNDTRGYSAGTSPDLNANGIPDECDDEGDLDGDGTVGVNDLLILLGAWGPCPDPCLPDINGDGSVDVLDLLVLLGSWDV